MHAVLIDNSKTGPVQRGIREHDALKMLKARKDFLLVQSAAKWNMRNFILAARKRSCEDVGAKRVSSVSPDKERTPSPPKKISADELPRFGLTVTKRMGNAVIRNRIKRRLRAGLRQIESDFACKGYDYVLIARRGALECPFTDMIRDLKFAFRKIHEKGNSSTTRKKSYKGHKNKPYK